VSEEVKLVINFKGDTATIGVSKPNCDPIFRSVIGNLGEVLDQIAPMMVEAGQQWGSNPRYPRCESKLPSQEAPPPKPATTTRQTTTAAPKKKEQTVLF
jgi:hypothetical protein